MEVQLHHPCLQHQMEVGGQIHAHATLLLRQEPQYPLGGRLGGPQSQSGCYREEKNLAPAWNQTLAVQPIACLYTDSAIMALVIK
jgi:hypothetical protein